MWLTFAAVDTIRVLISANSRNTCSSSSGVHVLLVRTVSCISLTNEPVSLRRRCKRSKVFRFGKRLEGNRSTYNLRASRAFPSESRELNGYRTFLD
ncbi:hypothetical protein TNIN_158591 [Trichonephila inaurata madagascariensis]|uniref:Uncharacterized protein n=1 Tax=Trichonephila inaurata madagascariensis TaxID=2747483 RepID=A0A8X6WM48_9ARAC|nr:hypothetical protein TNIN_158591 [Trichonephila inaurata madagascariensis]